MPRPPTACHSVADCPQNPRQVVLSPGGHHQWSPVATAAEPEPPKIRMLTTDISLTADKKYLAIAKTFAEDQAAFDDAFAHAW